MFIVYLLDLLLYYSKEKAASFSGFVTADEMVYFFFFLLNTLPSTGAGGVAGSVATGDATVAGAPLATAMLCRS
jgi:hypothetical protein